MNNAQLYLSIGVPVIAILVGIPVNMSQISNLANTMNSRFSALEARMTALETRVDTRIGALEAKMDAKFELVVGKIYELDNRLSRVEEQLDHLEDRFSR